MMIFLILAPFAAFAGLTMVTTAPVSLFAAAAVALATIAFDYARGASIKILASGSALVFLTVGGYVSLVDPGLSISSVRSRSTAACWRYRCSRSRSATPSRCNTRTK